MPDLSFQVENAEVVPFAVAPLLAFGLRVTNAAAGRGGPHGGAPLPDPDRGHPRRYAPEEEERLRDLFGEPERWGQTLRTMLWTHASVVVPAFEGERHGRPAGAPAPSTSTWRRPSISTALDDRRGPAHVPVQRQRLLRGLRRGAAGGPDLVGEGGDLPTAGGTWQELMDAYYPNRPGSHLRRDVFDRLYRYKVGHGIPTWEQALERILPRPTRRRRYELRLVERVANAVLYEGYMLYPYRRSAVKNQQRFNFGRALSGAVRGNGRAGRTGSLLDADRVPGRGPRRERAQREGPVPPAGGADQRPRTPQAGRKRPSAR